jgi:hypothetical protein
MAMQPLCDSCGRAIESCGWKLIPARVDHGHLAGTEQIGPEEYAERYPGYSGSAPATANVLIGEAADLCLSCVPLAHPRASVGD